MGSWGASTLPLKHLPLSPSLVSLIDCRCMTFYVRSCRFLRRGYLSSSVNRNCSKAVLLSGKQNSRSSRAGVWEDPDDGTESDYDEEGLEAEENEHIFESDWEEEKGFVVGTVADGRKSIKCEEELAKGPGDFVILNHEEIELLLEPEERAILDQNPAPNLEKISTEKWSALHTLALAGQIHFFDQLLENGISIDSVDKDGRTALHVSVIGKKEAVISHILRKGANPHVKDKDGVTPLHYAVQVSAMQTVKLLIKYNVDVNVPDNEGWTPLHIAMQSRSRDIAKVLLVNGADKTRKNKDGNTPLDLSLAYGKEFKSYDLAKLLKLVPANRDL